MFATRGSSATLNDLAKAAGVGVGTVYRKFADKDAVLDALFDEKVDTLVRLAETAEQIEDAGTAVRSLLLGVMEARATDRGLDAILMAPSRGARFAEALAERFVPAAEATVARAIVAGELRADFTAPEVCLLGFMVGKIADITRETDPQLWRRYAQLLVDGTRSGDVLQPAPLAFDDMIAALGRAT